MKAALLTLILLVHTWSSWSWVHNTGYEYIIRSDMDSLIRYGRACIAKRDQIANMNHVAYKEEWNKVLYDALGKLGGCREPEILYEASNEFSLDIYLNVKYEQLFDRQFTEPFVDGAGKIEYGLVVAECTTTGEIGYSVVFYKTNTEIIHGPPGSKCSDGKTSNSIGLCQRNPIISPRPFKLKCRI